MKLIMVLAIIYAQSKINSPTICVRQCAKRQAGAKISATHKEYEFKWQRGSFTIQKMGITVWCISTMMDISGRHTSVRLSFSPHRWRRFRLRSQLLNMSSSSRVTLPFIYQWYVYDALSLLCHSIIGYLDCSGNEYYGWDWRDFQAIAKFRNYSISFRSYRASAQHSYSCLFGQLQIQSQ